MAKSRSEGGNKPPQLGNVMPHFIKTFRYSMTNGSVSITSASIISACGGIATTATVLHPVVGSFKIHSVKMWAPSASSALATCSVAWEGGLFGLTKTVQDTSVSVTTPAKVFAKPPIGSTAEFWQSFASNNVLFTIQSNVSSTIVDVKMSCIYSDNSNPPYGVAVVGGTVGNVYFLGLDGLAVATSKFIPLGVPTGV
jgi:hypothetical protein